MPSSLARTIIVPALPRFIEQHPELAVKVDINDRAPRLMQEGVDAVLQIGTLRDSSLVARRIGYLHAVTCASPDFIERVGCQPLTPAELKPEHCIALFQPGSRRLSEWRFRRGKQAHTFLPSARLSFSDPESAVVAAVGGAGFVRTLDFAVRAQIAAGLLLPVLEDWHEGASWPVSILYPHRRPAPKIRAFVEFVSGLFPKQSHDSVADRSGAAGSE